MPGRSAFLALSLLVSAALAAPAWAQTEPAAPADKAPPARPATKPPAKPAASKPAAAAKTAAPAVPAAPVTPEEASRQAYKAKLAQDLARMQVTLQKQQADLANEQGKLKTLYSEMMEAVTKSDSDPNAAASAGAGAAPGGPPGPGGPNAKKELTPAVKASVNYEAQTYKVQVARQAVLSSEKEVLKLQGFLQRMSQ